MRNSTKRKIKRRYKWLTSRIKIIIKLVLIVVLLAVIIGGTYFYKEYGKLILDKQRIAKEYASQSSEETFRQNQTSLVYDCNGDLITTVKGDKDSYYLEYEDIPQSAKDVMVVTEDKSFYEHDGIDYKANLSAVVSLIKNKGEIKRGGSTITQQLARNIFLSHEVSWDRKVTEIYLAQELEKKYDKYQILEFYLNNIYFANGFYGLQAAANGYFGQSVNELSLSQIVFICAIPNNPTLYDPVTSFDNTIKRRDRMLKQMLDDGKIDNEEYTQACNEKITLNMSKRVRNDYVETYVYYCATRALMSKAGFVFKNDFDTKDEKEQYQSEYSSLYNECQQQLFSKGYRIYTSIDLSKQEKLQETINNQLSDYDELKEDGIYAFQGAGVCIDNSTGRVVAIVGGRKQDTTGYTLNRGFQSFRQPGSSIKPLLIYAPAFENGMTPDSKVVDEEIEDGPKNSGGGYSGEITMRRAVEKSVNTVAWKLFDELGTRYCLGYLVDLNFSRIGYSDDYPAASLGGFTYGASPVEMAAAFATLENDGIYRTPTCIVKIMNAQGEEIIGESISKKEVYSQNTARMLTDVMAGVLKTGTGKGYALSNMACAGKTGTTDNKKDGWFVGYTPYYTTSIWVGYDTPRATKELLGNTFPLYIWHDYMESIHKNLEYREFESYVEIKADDPDAAQKEAEEKLEEENAKKTKKPNKSTKEPTKTPTKVPVKTSSPEPTIEATVEPTVVPTVEPTVVPTIEWTNAPTNKPILEATKSPTKEETASPTKTATVKTTKEPIAVPPTVTVEPTKETTVEPAITQASVPTKEATAKPTEKIDAEVIEIQNNE